MELDTPQCYQALLTRDARFDGVFFVGVATTGIYCRPVCTARTPREENCTFHASAAAAERAGFRPCLRCRPELAPGRARIDAVGRLAAAAADRIEDGALSGKSLPELAAELGVSDRHLRRAVETAFGVSPVALAQTQRLLLAKRLLTDTDLPVTRIAYASGFASLRRFQALFRERYRLNPSELRRTRGKAPVPETLVCELAYRPPYEKDAHLGFLAGRAAQQVELVTDGIYRRTVALGGRTGWVAAAFSPDRATLTVTLDAALAPVLSTVLARMKRLFDLSAEPERIAAHLGELAATRPGLRVPGAFDGFELAVRAILGQQVSVKAATTLAGRIAEALGEPIETPFPGLTRLSPTPERLAAAEPEDLAALGIVLSRARAIVALARAVVDDGLRLEPGGDIEPTLARLKALPGIGEWTAEYIALRALQWPDAFPHTDLGLRQALKLDDPRDVLAAAEPWRPWRGYAALHLWKSLEETDR